MTILVLVTVLGPESPSYAFSGPSFLRPEARGSPALERASLRSCSSSRLFQTRGLRSNGEGLSFLPISDLSWLS